MTNPKPLYALASFLILTVALPGCATFRECGSSACHDDAKISANVQTLLDRRPELGPPHAIDVQTDQSCGISEWICGCRLGERDGESVAGEAPGVARVVNNIAVTH